MPDSRQEERFGVAVCAICQEISDVENSEVDKPCKQCKHFYCKNHTSKVDPDYCDSCLRPGAVATQDHPLIDEDGQKHEGRRIVLSGEFWMSMQVDVIKMSEEELKQHIAALKAAVREIEVIRDYRKIALGHAENELEQKTIGKYRRLRILDEYRGGKITAKQVIEMKSKPKPRSAEQILASLGLTPEQIVSALKTAQRMKKK